ncbi:MAG: DUF3489 domain-containing protein, partial [Methylobacteriaceae bacterium]|nr:DUF3489 domain-containing protein [Methylobacteriaceae bacterium]
MTKLTDTQLIILSGAAQRKDGHIVLPNHLKGGAAAATIKPLIKRGLVTEVAARKGTPVHRRDEDGQGFVLVITEAGLQAIGVEEPQASIADDVGSKEVDTRSAQAEQEGRKGRGGSRKRPVDPTPNDRTAVPREAGTGASRRPDTGAQVANAPRDGSKLSGVIALLEQARGVTLDELIAATGWLPHTTRAALTSLRKRGYSIVR